MCGPERGAFRKVAGDSWDNAEFPRVQPKISLSGASGASGRPGVGHHATVSIKEIIRANFAPGFPSQVERSLKESGLLAAKAFFGVGARPITRLP
jgi:hypothetical protein